MTMNMGVNVSMDVRKWSWPASLTFGSGSSTPASKAEAGPADETVVKPPDKGEGEGEGGIAQSTDEEGKRQEPSGTIVDAQALEDALASASISSPTRDVEISAATPQTQGPSNPSPEKSMEELLASEDEATIDHPGAEDSQRVEETPNAREPLSFSQTYVHLPSSADLSATRRKLVRYIKVRRVFSLFSILF